MHRTELRLSQLRTDNRGIRGAERPRLAAAQAGIQRAPDPFRKLRAVLCVQFGHHNDLCDRRAAQLLLARDSESGGLRLAVRHRPSSGRRHRGSGPFEAVAEPGWGSLSPDRTYADDRPQPAPARTRSASSCSRGPAGATRPGARLASADLTFEAARKPERATGGPTTNAASDRADPAGRQRLRPKPVCCRAQGKGPQAREPVGFLDQAGRQRPGVVLPGRGSCRVLLNGRERIRTARRSEIPPRSGAQSPALTRSTVARPPGSIAGPSDHAHTQTSGQTPWRVSPPCSRTRPHQSTHQTPPPH